MAIQNRFTALADGTGEWDTFNDAHTKCDAPAEEVLGFRRYVRHEWISDRIRNLVEKKRTARLNHDMGETFRGQAALRFLKCAKASLIWPVAI